MEESVSLWGIIAIIILVLCNGFFVAAEFAIVKVRKSQIDLEARNGSGAAKATQKVLSNLDSYLAATQLGITLSSLALGWIGESTMHVLITRCFDLFGLDVHTKLISGLSFFISFSLITMLHIVLGELAPKSLAIQYPTSTSLKVARPLMIFTYIFRPVIWMLNAIAIATLKLFKIKVTDGHDETHSNEELQILLNEGKETGALDEAEHELIKNVFDFQELVVKNIMIPRTQLCAIEINTTFEEALDTIISEGYSRIPVYEKDVDHIVGVLHAKDILGVVAKNNKKATPIKSILREPLFTPESKKISDLLTEMRTHKKSMMAIVLDEFGGTAGIITLEDIMEELVGDIQDEYDEETHVVEQLSEKEFLVNALIPVNDVNDHLPIKLKEDEDYDSVAGLVNIVFGEIPNVGDKKDFDHYNFEIIKKDHNTIERVKLTILEPESKNKEEQRNEDKKEEKE